MQRRFQNRLGFVLSTWVVWVVRLRYPVIAAFAAFGFYGINYAANNLGVNTDTADMISPEVSWRQDFIDFRESFPGRYRIILAVVEGPNAGQTERAAVQLARRLAQLTDVFSTVFLPAADPFLQRNGLLYLSETELEALSDRLARVQPLLGQLRGRFSAERLIGVIDEALARLDESRRDELTPMLAELERTLSADNGYEFDWRGLMSAPDMHPPPQIIVLEPQLDFTQLRPGRAAMEALREEANALMANQPGVSVGLTGTVAMEDEELVSVTAGAALAGGLALLMVTVVLFVALRSLVLLVSTVVTLLVGLLGTATFAAASVGHLNLISVAFAVLYIGLGVDFVIHWTLRFQELRRQGMAPEVALAATARGVGTSLVICAVTTAIGFYSFIPTPFSGVSELGLISGTGMFISLFVTLTLLPALLSFLPGPVPTKQRWAGAAVLQRVVRRRRGIVLAALLLGLASLSVLPGVRFDNNPLNLRDPNSESVLAFKALSAGVEPPLSMFALADPNVLGRERAAVAQLPLVKAVRAEADLVPGAQGEKLLSLEDLDLLLGPDFAVLDADPEASPERLGLALGQLADRLSNLPQPGVREERLADLLSAAAANGSTSLADLGRRLSAGLPYELDRLAEGLLATRFDADQLPATLATRWRAPDGRRLIEIMPAVDLADDQAAESFVAQVRGAIPHATGLPVVHQEAGRTVLTSFMMALIYALLIIAALLWLLLQDFKDALLVLMPIVLGALLTGAATVVFDMPFNFANIIALPLLLGVGVDNGIHMVHRARTEPSAAGDALDTSTARAILFSGLTTLASFGNLGFSAHLGMASMGQLLAIGMALTLMATLVLLPALLGSRR